MSRLAAFDPFEPSGAASPSPARRYMLLDVFTEHPLQGNQLAVFLDGLGIEGAEMQAVAREMKLSESVFVLPPEGEGDVRVRIFTPEAELPFAGHPVLGTATVVAGALGSETVVLETGAGPIEVRVGDWRGRVASGSMEQPIPTWQEFPAPADLLAALGLPESLLPIEVYDNGPLHVYVALPSADAVAALEPDLVALARLGDYGVSCFAGQGSRFKTRMFGPALGVAEDPATGSAAGPLAVHLARHGWIPFGREIEIEQGAEIRRPSLLRARAEGSAAGIDSVVVAGDAAIVGHGELWLG